MANVIPILWLYSLPKAISMNYFSQLTFVFGFSKEIISKRFGILIQLYSLIQRYFQRVSLFIIYFSFQYVLFR